MSPTGSPFLAEAWLTQILYWVVPEKQYVKDEYFEIVLGLWDFFFNLIRFKGISDSVSNGKRALLSLWQKWQLTFLNYDT